MTTNVNKIIAKLPRHRRKRIEARAKALIGEEMTRQRLRQIRNRTQVEIAAALGITQDSVSRLEQRPDILVSTLRKYVKAMGGNLSIVAEFPDQAPVKLAGFAEETDRRPAITRRRKLTKMFASLPLESS
jgi:transcriptional regulator with XRE-family HTH domain